jgi:hypothetical protein
MKATSSLVLPASLKNLQAFMETAKETAAAAGLNGRPFVISAVPPPDLASGVDERRIGGLGIHLMKSLIDEVSYRREEEKNVLSLRISLASPDG